MTFNRIAPTSPTNPEAGTGANNLRSLEVAASASSNQQAGLARAPTRSRKIAQAFPAPGSISGQPSPITKPRTDAIILGSFDPKISLEPGGGAGFLDRYIFEPLASFATNTPAVSDDTTNSLGGIVDNLKAQKKLNNGKALSRISIVSHGDSGRLRLGNGAIYSVSEIVQPIMANGLLKPGGRLVLGGCWVASSTQACAELMGWAKKFNIVIQASEVPTAYGSENLAYMAFYPNGKITRNLGPFAPF